MGLQEKTPDPLRPDDVARDDVKLSANRCPYCHTGVEAAEADHVVCKGCLARHHQSCWEEAGACSACGGTEALVSQATAQAGPVRRERSGRLLLAVAAATLVALGLVVVGAYLRLGVDASTEPTRAEPPVVHVAPAPPAPPAGTFEVELEQRTGGFVDGIDGLEVWAGDVKAVSETRFTLSFGEGSATVSLRVGDTRAVLVDGRRFSVHFARQEDSVFGFSEDRAAIWITPRD